MMANETEQEEYDVALLPDGRAVRILALDARRMLELTRRVGRLFPVAKPGEAPEMPQQSDMMVETQKATIALCVRGITLKPVEIKFTEVADPNFKPTGDEKPATKKVPDLMATLGPYCDRQSPEFGRWVNVGEMQLENDTPSNPLSMFKLFKAPTAWKAVLDRIADAGGGGFGADPFAGKTLKTSAG
jgi:hypothetical protein